MPAHEERPAPADYASEIVFKFFTAKPQPVSREAIRPRLTPVPVVRKATRDRRVHRRVSFNTELWIGDDGLFARARARMNDVSIGGARIVTHEAYRMGAILSLRFGLDGDFITATAIVRNVRPGSVGVEFLDLSPDKRGHLEAFIEACDPQDR